MKDPLPLPIVSQRGFFGQNNGSAANHSNFNQNRNNSSSNVNGGHRKKSDYCWNFNRGLPCKFGTKCKFIERCKYCDSPSHGVNNCFKLKKKQEGKTTTQERKNGGDN